MGNLHHKEICLYFLLARMPAALKGSDNRSRERRSTESGRTGTPFIGGPDGGDSGNRKCAAIRRDSRLCSAETWSGTWISS